MPLSSMTGFARAEGECKGCAWAWEARSVNGKGLDTRLRLAPGFEALDPQVRKRVGQRLKRGNVSVQLSAAWAQAGAGYRVNHDMLEQILALLPSLHDRLPGSTPPQAETLLTIRGVVEQAEDELPEETMAEIRAAAMGGLDRALDGLEENRRAEGARLLDVVSGQVDLIGELTSKAASLAAAQPDAIARRLREQVEALLADVPALSEERLAQEAAVLMVKADLREELDRLAAHVEAARDLLSGDGAVGRKLDFLCQEFNREANTLCSKSQDVELTRVGLDLKAVIDQLREQVQNIE